MAGPDIQVSHGSPLANGETIALGTVAASALTVQLTIANTTTAAAGANNLNLDTLTATTDASIDANDDPSNTFVSPEMSTTVTVDLDTSAYGSQTGQLTIPSDDINGNDAFVVNFTWTVGRTITVTVTNGTSAVSGASVTLGTDTQTTNGSGVATFTAVLDGSYSLAITATGYTFDTTSIDTDATHTAFTEVVDLAPSIFELVTQNIRTTLEAMTVGTYGFTPLVRRRCTVKAPTSKGVKADGTLYTVEIEVLMNGISEQSRKTGKTYWVVDYSLSCFIDLPDSSETPIDAAAAQVFSGVIRALMADAQRGGYASDSMLKDGTSFIIPEMGMAGIDLTLSVQVRTAEHNPQSP